jgi:hypothetical protein
MPVLRAPGPQIGARCTRGTGATQAGGNQMEAARAEHERRAKEIIEKKRR